VTPQPPHGSDSPVTHVAEQLEGILGDPQALSQLRGSIVAMQKRDEPNAREAGRRFGAAIGALAQLRDGGAPAQLATRLQQAITLFNSGLDHWFAHVRAELGDAAADNDTPAAVATALAEIGAMCGAGRDALAGDPDASARVDQHAAAARAALAGDRVPR